MLHPDAELFESGAGRGLGVRATALIPAGTITWTLCHLDRVLSPARLASLPPAYQPVVRHFAYRDHEGAYVLCWDAARYMNHSCRANTRGVGPWAQVALRDIEVGEEITCDYGECNLEEELACRCGSPGCRGAVGPADLARLADGSDLEVRLACRRARDVDQPLRPFFEHRSSLLVVLEGRAPPPSIRSLACADAPPAA